MRVIVVALLALVTATGCVATTERAKTRMQPTATLPTAGRGHVFSPSTGILCDRANQACFDTDGVSVGFTDVYLGRDSADLVEAKQIIGGATWSASGFVLSNGVSCNTSRRQCSNLSYTQVLYGGQ